MSTQDFTIRLIDAISKIYRGTGPSVELVVTAFLAGGHLLLEDIPGVGKTTLARALAQAVGGTFRRLQCTPDLMPSDITGVSIYDERERNFIFHPGPLFCDVLLADELNRTPPRTQAALLEAMSEGQVTIDGQAKALSPTFLCLATQNPLDHAGTFPLPDSQRDRFLIAMRLGYPGESAELDLLASDGAEAGLHGLTSVLAAGDSIAMRANLRSIRVSDDVRRYLLSLVLATRSHKAVQLGASPRAAIGLQRACQARAIIHGRNFVIPEDVQALAGPCLAHRLAVRMGQPPLAVIQGLVDSLPVPR